MKNIVIISFIYLFSQCSYANNDTISIIRHAKESLFSPKTVKVAYRGINNVLEIIVPNCKSFVANANGLKRVSNTVYSFIPDNEAEVIITIDIVLKNKKRIIEKHLFKIYNTQIPLSTINNYNSNSLRISKNKLKNAVVNVKSQDKYLDISYNVVQFTVIHQR